MGHLQAVSDIALAALGTRIARISAQLAFQQPVGANAGCAEIGDFDCVAHAV